MNNEHALEEQMAVLQDRIGSLHTFGAHQLWCGLFGEVVGWNDELIHRVEPFLRRYLRLITESLLRGMTSNERSRYVSWVTAHRLMAEETNTLRAENKRLRAENERLRAENDDLLRVIDDAMLMIDGDAAKSEGERG